MPSRQKDFSKVFADSLKSKNNNVLYQKKYFFIQGNYNTPCNPFPLCKEFQWS